MTTQKPRPSRYATEVRRSRSGLGLYATEPIPRGRFIIEYWGPLAGDAKADRVGGKYLFDMENGKTILGGTRKNTARYANHSCRPNSEVRIAKFRVYIHATRNIRAGEEIAYDYGEEYFNTIITKRRCRCPKCSERRAKARAASAKRN